MADECTDIANKEQFTICMRWVDDSLGDHEDFIGLYQVDKIDAATLAGTEEKRAVYTHCYGHALNLAVGITMKQSKLCRDSMEVAFEVSKLIEFSLKRNAAFDRIKEYESDDDISGIGIRSFCPTRWTVHGASISSILENYNILNQLWDECLEAHLVPNVKGRIIGVKAQMCQFQLLFGLYRIAGKFDGDLNLANWRFWTAPPKFILAKFTSFEPLCYRQLATAKFKKY